MRQLPTPLFTPLMPDAAGEELLCFGQSNLEKSCPERILRWAADTFGDDMGFAPSWNEEDAMIRFLLDRIGVRLPVVENIRDLLMPEKWTPLTAEDTSGDTFDGRTASAALWARFHLEHLCKQHETLIRRYRAWIVSPRRDETPSLDRMPVLSWNERFGVFRIAPLTKCGTFR